MTRPAYVRGAAVLAFVLVSPAAVAGQPDPRDKAECRAAHPGNEYEALKAFADCLRERAEAPARRAQEEREAEWKRVEADLPTYNLEQAQQACQRDMRACPRRDELKEQERAENERRY
jgi:hypothetical protein